MGLPLNVTPAWFATNAHRLPHQRHSPCEAVAEPEVQETLMEEIEKMK
jgi:hypothetical protein